MDNPKETKKYTVGEALAEFYIDTERKQFEAILKQLWRLTMEDACRDGLISENNMNDTKTLNLKKVTK